MNIDTLIRELPKEIQNIIFFNAITITPTAKLIKDLKNKIYLIKRLKLEVELQSCIKIFDSYFININANDEHKHILNMLIKNYDNYNIISIKLFNEINYNSLDYFNIPELAGVIVFSKNGYNFCKDIWKYKCYYTCYDHELIEWEKIN
tara:strand:- start:632 stop:1075 length:444 start_codon:yes stop_codon:yes gene_type:complete